MDISVLLEYDQIFGQGEFGIVLKGVVTPNANHSYTAAVKTLKSHDMNHLRALLSELKIMIYIGYHKNIIRLIGAVTSKLSESMITQNFLVPPVIMNQS